MGTAVDKIGEDITKLRCVSKITKAVNESTKTSVNSFCDFRDIAELGDILTSFIYSSAHKHQGANDFPADLYLQGMEGPPFIS